MTPNNNFSEDTQYNPNYGNTQGNTTPPPVPDMAAQQAPKPGAPAKKKPAKKSDNTVAKVAVGAGTGVVVGALAATLMSMGRGDGPTEETDDQNDTTSKSGAEAYTDGQVEVAHNVSDDMSFAEAFAAARQEVGPGGCFEWHGQVYGTYTATEWNGMSAQEKQAYENHFNWNKFQSTGSEQHTEQHHDPKAGQHAQTEHVQQQQTAETEHVHQQHTAGSEDVIGKEEVAENYDGGDDDKIHGKTEVAEVTDGGDDVEIEVLGIAHSNESGAYYASMSVDSQEVVLIDVDGDMEFDFLTADVNQNQIIEDEEIEPIYDKHITVDGLMQAGNIDTIVEMYPDSNNMAANDDFGIDDITAGDDMATI